jgi:hypothetical protein
VRKWKATSNTVEGKEKNTCLVRRKKVVEEEMTKWRRDRGGGRVTKEREAELCQWVPGWEIQNESRVIDKDSGARHDNRRLWNGPVEHPSI